MKPRAALFLSCVFSILAFFPEMLSAQQAETDTLCYRTIDLYPQNDYAERNGYEDGDTVGVNPYYTEHRPKYPRPQLRIYPAAPENNSGCVVLAFPGGAYLSIAINGEGYDWAPFFHDLGVTYVVMTYRLPYGNDRIPQTDVYRAIRYLRAHAGEYGFRPDRLGVMGSSAGGHLASTVATHAAADARPDFQMLFYPVITMDSLLTHKSSRKYLIGPHPSDSLVRLYSNELQVDSLTPPALLLLSNDDKVVLPENSVAYYDALRRQGIPASMHIYPVGGHGWGARESFRFSAAVRVEIRDWMRQRGLIPSPEPLPAKKAEAPSAVNADPLRPEADARATVVSGNARFTVLTPRLVRMEWSADGRFEDRATLGVINRRLEVPPFEVKRQGDTLEIRTDSLTLTYLGGRFEGDNLSVTFPLNGMQMRWTPAMDVGANLSGTARTLDQCKGFSQINGKENRMDPGILSRDGWAVVDESQRHLLLKDTSDWGEWVSARDSVERKDLYLFAYGHDYTAALQDFTRISGRIPMPPKYAFGYWWSRYWIYTDDELKALGKEMRERRIPMDIMVIDMDWHETWKPMTERKGRNAFRHKRGWTGYTWNRDLFPDPEGFLKEIHAMQFKTALNLHPATGILPYDECYPRFVKDYLSRTSDYDGPKDYVYTDEPYQFREQEDTDYFGEPGYRAIVPFRMSQKEWADAYFHSVIHPLEEQGIDFWWLDYQQWPLSRYVKGLSNTFWLNYTFFNDKVRRTRQLGLDAPRPFIYHRWGGLGSHRYPLGFSGDTYDEWPVLAFLPYFTATASNLCYAYWGHDLGGHMQLEEHPTDPEMFTRWLQFGVFTPIFKTHSAQSELLDRRIWSYPTHYEYLKAAIELRYALSPYIYTQSRYAYDHGVGICRPMYYDYPEKEEAYLYREQYMFGDRILATAVCRPADSLTGKAERMVWFPEGLWYDMARHMMYPGGTASLMRYSISENPWYVKAGSILPLAREGIQNLQERDSVLRWLIVPGMESSSFDLYEDDGNTQAYTGGAYAFTHVEKEVHGRCTRICFHPRQGSYKGAFASHRVSLLFEACRKPPRRVSVNGKRVKVQVCQHPVSVEVFLPEIPADRMTRVEVEF